MTSVPPTQPPAAPETDVRLTEAEREALWEYVRISPSNHDRSQIAAAAARIVAERVRVVEGEAASLRADWYSMRAQLTAQYARADEAAADLEAARERVRVVESERELLAEQYAAEVEELESDVIAEEARANENATLVHQERARAESAKAAHAALVAAVEALADKFDSNVDWSAGRNNYGDNEAWESAARQVRALAGGALRAVVRIAGEVRP